MSTSVQMLPRIFHDSENHREAQLRVIENLLRQDPAHNSEDIQMLKVRIEHLWIGQFLSTNLQASKQDCTYCICLAAKLAAVHDLHFAATIFHRMILDLLENGEESLFDMGNVLTHLYGEINDLTHPE